MGTDKDLVPMKEAVPAALGLTDMKERLAAYKELAESVVEAGMAPKGMNAAGVMVAMQSGSELGFTPMRALSCVTVVNGRAGLMGEAALGLLRARGALKEGTDLEVEYGGDGDSFGATCRLHPKHLDKPVERTFTVAMAKKARLWGKGGPWTEYPARMLMWRALGFLLRDYFSHVTNGMPLEYEVRDIPSAEASWADAPADLTPTAPKERDPLADMLGPQNRPTHGSFEDDLAARRREPVEIEDAEVVGDHPGREVSPEGIPELLVKATCPCGSADEYPHGESACTACRRRVYVTAEGEVAWDSDDPPCEPWCALDDGHDGACMTEAAVAEAMGDEEEGDPQGSML